MKRFCFLIVNKVLLNFSVLVSWIVVEVFFEFVKVFVCLLLVICVNMEVWKDLLLGKILVSYFVRWVVVLRGIRSWLRMGLVVCEVMLWIFLLLLLRVL